MKKPGLLLFLIVLAANRSSAAFERGGPLGFGTRAMGMGGAWIAAGGDLASLYWNPAGLRGVEGSEITVESGTLFGGKDGVGMASYALAPSIRSRLAFQGALLNHPGAGGLSERSFGTGAAFFDPEGRWSFGAGLRFLNAAGTGTFEAKASGFSMDLGAQGMKKLKGHSSLQGGMALQDLGGGLSWDGSVRQSIPARISAGAAVWAGGTSLFAVDASARAWGPVSPGRGAVLRGGLELQLLEGRVLVRAGSINYRTQSGLMTAGVSGLGRNWQAHYAFAGHPGPLGASHRLAFVFAFKNPSWGAPGSAGKIMRDRLLRIEQNLQSLKKQAGGSETLGGELENERMRLRNSHSDGLKSGSLPAGAKRGPEKLEKNPLYKKGLEYLGQGEFSREAEVWRTLIQSYPDVPRLRENLSRAEARLRISKTAGKVEQAKP